MQQAFASAFNLFAGTTAIKYSFLGLLREQWVDGNSYGWHWVVGGPSEFQFGLVLQGKTFG